jgi:hypothetical protein
MPYTATVKLSYINDTETSSSKYFPEIVDKQTIIVEAPTHDLNTHQYFELFKSFLRAIGFTDYNIMDAACRVAFNDSNDEAQMKKLMDEYELQDKQAYDDDDCRAMEEEIRDLKEKLARVLPQEYEQPADIYDEDYPRGDGTSWNAWNGLVPGSPEAVANSCSCPVIDNAEMPNDHKWVNGDCPLHGKVK